MSRFKSKPELMILVIQDGAKPKELMLMGYTKATSYGVVARSKKILEEYFIQRRKLKELRKTN